MADGAPKPHHAVCLPYPAQGHINPMLKFAILLHSRGFYITFVNTEYNHRRLLKSQGPEFLTALPNFKFETIPDGLPTTDDEDAAQDIVSLLHATQEDCLAPFQQLLIKLNNESPVVSCVIPDAIMCFGVVAAKEIGVPSVSFRVTCAVSFFAERSLPLLIDKGLLPIKDSSYLTNEEYLETPLQITFPELRNFRIKDLPNFARTTTDRNDFMLNTLINLTEQASTATAIIFNTFDELEHDILIGLAKICPPIYPIGPVHFHFHTNHLLPEATLNLIRGNLRKEDSECLEWLSDKPPKSVLYVNFGSIAVLSYEQVMELAWGLAKSEKNILWIVRDDLIMSDRGRQEIQFPEFTEGKVLISKWCPQEQVLQHPSIGGFLTHCGWNSMIESLCCGVPMICLPIFFDQHMNCRAACAEWGVGIEIENGVERNQVEKLVRDVIDGEKGKELQKTAEEWKSKAEAATKRDGSSYLNFDKLIKELFQSNHP